MIVFLGFFLQACLCLYGGALLFIEVLAGVNELDWHEFFVFAGKVDKTAVEVQQALVNDPPDLCLNALLLAYWSFLAD